MLGSWHVDPGDSRSVVDDAEAPLDRRRLLALQALGSASGTTARCRWGVPAGASPGLPLLLRDGRPELPSQRRGGATLQGVAACASAPCLSGLLLAMRTASRYVSIQCLWGGGPSQSAGRCTAALPRPSTCACGAATPRPGEHDRRPDLAGLQSAAVGESSGERWRVLEREPADGWYGSEPMWDGSTETSRDEARRLWGGAAGEGA